MSKRKQSRQTQYGMTTLVVSLVVLLASTLVFFGLNSSTLTELKTANNFYYQARAQEAARGGAEYGYAWITNASLTWIRPNEATNPSTPCTVPVSPGCKPDPSYNEYVDVPTPASLNNHALSIRFWRNYLGDTSIIEVVSVAIALNADGLVDGRAAVRSKFHLLSGVSFNFSQVPPAILNGCFTNSVGTPNVNLFSTGAQIAVWSSQNCNLTDLNNFDLFSSATATGFTGNLQSTGPSNIQSQNLQQVQMNGSAWNYLFGISKAEMKSLAKGPVNNIYYFDASCPYPCTQKYQPSPALNANGWNQNIGTLGPPTSAVSLAILIFDDGSGCPGPRGNTKIYGIVYYGAGCSSQDFNGTGTVDIYGLLISDGNINKLNGSITIHESLYTTNASYYNNGNARTVSPITGSWRDFE